MAIARKIAVQHLPTDTYADAQILAFSQGAFHRLYRIFSPLAVTEYLIRVALPVEPFYKTESEVATMEYVTRNSPLPVPRVVAYDSNASNELGFEWILMEKVDGTPLAHVWDAMPFEAKKRLSTDLARSYQILWRQPLPLYGNIYHIDVWNQVGFMPTMVGRSSCHHDVGVGGSFVIGRMVSTRFFRDKRALLRSDRGPFTTSRELAMAEAKLIAQRVRHLSPSPGADYYCEADEMMAEEEADVIDTADGLVQAVSRAYSPNDVDEIKVLWHDDMSMENVLVNPTTHELVGIVDWESVSVVPAWATDDGVPHFLRGISVDEPPPIGTTTSDEEEGLTEIRKDWELVLLRRAYKEALFSPPLLPPWEKDPNTGLKITLSGFLADFEDGWTRARYWLGNSNVEGTEKGEEALVQATPDVPAQPLEHTEKGAGNSRWIRGWPFVHIFARLARIRK